MVKTAKPYPVTREPRLEAVMNAATMVATVATQEMVSAMAAQCAGPAKVQISTCEPSSTTRLVGSLKNSIALSALRSIQANNFSRQIAIPGREEASRVWRARKKLVSIILHGEP